MPGSSHINAHLRSHRRAAFTLVEMLAVMGIIVLLVAATLPALRGFSQSESRRGAVGNMLAVLDRARMMAISDGLSTYVVFACPYSASETQINADLRGRAYAIYEDGDNISFIPTQKTPWFQLPKGTAFTVQAVATTGTGSVTNGANNDCITARFATLAPTSADASFPISAAASGYTASGASLQLPYWKFDGTGSVTEQTYLRLLIFPGFVDGNGKDVFTQNIGSSSGSVPVQFEEIRINPATGRAAYTIDPVNNLQSTPSPLPTSSP